MRHRKRWIRLAMGLAMVVMLSACRAGMAAPSPTPSATPAFETNDEAIAAAIATYERYLVINAEVNADHGADAERILEVTTNAYGTQLLAEFRKMREVGVHITGAATLAQVSQLLSIDEFKRDVEVVLCVDVAGTRIINEAGEDVTPDGDGVSSLAVSFTAQAGRMLLAGSELWSGENSC